MSIRDVLLPSENHIRIAQAAQNLGRPVVIQGWVHHRRSSGKIGFLEVRDGSGYLQVVAEKPKLDPESNVALDATALECSVQIQGELKEHPRKKGEFELHASKVTLIGSSPEYPLGQKEHGPDFLLENRHLWLRAPAQWAIQRIRNTLINGTYEYFRERGYIKIDAPIITSTACEGTTTLFSMEYHDLGTAYLSQSGQLYIEAAVMSHGRVFDFGPVFRAEKSKTKKHLSEFWMMDAEMAFCDHQHNMAVQEELVCFLVGKVLRENRPELALTGRSVAALEKVKAPFPRVTHAEIVKLLQAKGSKITASDDLGAPDEELLKEMYDIPLFIERWPAAIKAFYMKRDPSNPEIVLGADLMAPEGYGEIIGGSQREDDYETLRNRMEHEGVPLSEFQWYLDLRKFGSVPHAGFGFGLERLVNWIAGAEHIRETIPFPRMLYRFKP